MLSSFRTANILETLTVLGLIFGAVVGCVATASFDSALGFIVFFVVGVGLAVWGQIYKKQNSPKFKRVDRKQVIITDPVMGDLQFVK